MARHRLQQVVQIPLQFFGSAADAGGAGDDAHAVGTSSCAMSVAQFVAVFAFDAARHAAAARVVWHQHQIAAGEADEGGQRSTLVAAFVLFHLDDEFLAFFQGILDAGLATSTPWAGSNCGQLP